MFSVPNEKVVKLKTFIRNTVRVVKSSARELAQVAGQLSEEVHWELKFWLKNLEKYNGTFFAPRPNNTIMIFSDASDTGYGGYLVHKLGQHICAGRFVPGEADMNSTYRELFAVEYV